jgi:glycerol uptake facilitator protein
VEASRPDDETEVGGRTESLADAEAELEAAAAVDTYGDIPERGPAAYVAEFIGTFALVLFITLVVSQFGHAAPSASELAQGAQQQFVDFSVIGLLHVFALFFLIQTLAIVSGAHFNPAVTLAMLVIRQIRAADAVIYWLCQLAGGIVAALITKALLTDEGTVTHYGATTLSSQVTVFGGICAEALGTFFLVWAIVGVAVNPQAVKGWAGLVIGGALAMGVMIMGPITGAGFNPARSFGPAIVGHGFDPNALKWLLIYVVGPAVGGVAAAVTYFYMFILPGKKGLEGMEPVG